ncbi:hypothetical protein BSKO_05490 [Bryopsis sp. KO-2023]|nr:hypothetical protein BSKO_05490 [Bryopsis sp. KO-2023]
MSQSGRGFGEWLVSTLSEIKEICDMSEVGLPPQDTPDRDRPEGEFSQRACEQLAILIRCLVDALHKFQHLEADVLTNSEEAQHLLEELKSQLHQAKTLVDRSYKMPWMYKIINAFQIRSEFRNVCHALGLTLEGLHSLLSSEKNQLKDDLKKLEWAFRNAMFPMDSVELKVFKEARNISSQIYRATVTLSQGVGLLRDMLEKLFGVENVHGQWKLVAEHLFRDMDAARMRKDRMEEHYLRQLVWAMSGQEAPPEFYCPISLEIMEEPVVLFETAVTYDRKSIETWLFAYGSNRCPVSGRILSEAVFVENRPLRSLIEEWKRTHFAVDKDDVPDSLTSKFSGDEEEEEDMLKQWDTINSIEKTGTASCVEATDTMESDPLEFLTNTGEDWNGNMTRGGSFKSMSILSTGSGSRTRQRLREKEVMLEMMAAAEDGDLEAVIEIGDAGWDLAKRDQSGRTVLHLAAAQDRPKILEYLLGKGLDVNAATTGDCATSLYLAALAGHYASVEVLLAHGANVAGINQHGWTALHAAADQGHGDVSRLLLEHGQECGVALGEMRSVSGWTALHHATRRGGISTVMQMLPFYIDVNLKCEVGWTPLHVAVDNGHRDVVKLLLTATNANPNVQSKDGWTSLHAAQDKNYIDIGRVLLKYGADPDIQSAEGVTALHRATYLNHLEFATMLVSDGKADLQKKTKAGRRAMQIASDLGHQEIYNYLFKKSLRRMFKSRG